VGAAAGNASDRLLNGASAQKYEPFVNAFLQGLKETGYLDSQNLLIEYRWADG